MVRGVHAKDQTAFRLDPDLRARLKAQAEQEGRTMTDAVSEAIRAWLDHRDGITTSAPAPAAVSPPAPATPVFLAAEDEQPKRAGKKCDHRIPPGAWCKECKTTKPAKESKR